MHMIGFAIATILPVGLIGIAAWLGGVWSVLALLYITLFAAALDRFVPRLLPEVPEGAEFPSGKVGGAALCVADRRGERHGFGHIRRAG